MSASAELRLPGRNRRAAGAQMQATVGDMAGWSASPGFRFAGTWGSVAPGSFGRAAPMLAYTAPTTVEEAARTLAGASGVVKVLSGGTDLLVQLRSGRAKPDLIVDIKNIPDLSGIAERDGSFVIGAATSGAVIGECEALRQAWPGVVEAANLIGSTQIQGRATLAGNLCNASPAADSVPALIAARATCVVAGTKGRREAPVDSIVTGPGRTSLGRDEFIVAFHLPKRPPRSGDAYLRFIPRTEMDIAVVGAAVSVTLDAGGVCTDARVVLGAVAPTAVVVAEAAAALIGRALDATALDGLDQAAQRACKPIDDKRGTIEYRTKVAGVLARRTATIAYQRAGKR
jgi:CO/xanthine dehydrogenase FAD-binding subunit